MIKTDDVLELVKIEVDKLIEKEPTMNGLIGDIKKSIMFAMTKKGITVEDSIGVSARLIILASMV